jgi:hypothetical protein
MPSLLDSALGWMQDPRRTQQLQGTGRAIQQGLLNIEKSDKRFQDLFDKSFGDPKQPFKVTDKKALSQLAEMTQSGLLGMAEVGMFVGAGSKAFDKAMAFAASKLEKKGITPQEIWKETGTVRGPDGQWRQEISDKESFVKGTKPFEDVIMGAYDRGVLKTGNQLYKTTVEDVMYHNPLKEAYPELMNTETRMLRKGSDSRGSLRKDVMNKQQVLEVRKDLPPEDARSTMLHELQHGIQESEGFAAGGNAETMDRLIGKAKERDFLIKQSDEWKSANDLVNNVYDKYFAGQLNLDELKLAEKQLQEQYPILREQITASDTARKIGDDPVDAYKRLMGEAEARLTQTRRNLSPEERKQYFPFEYMDLERNPYGLDVPPEHLLNLNTKGYLVEKGLLGQ